MKFNGNTVLITGGASGIGRLMGGMALDKGAGKLIIWDINQQNIDSTIAELKQKGQVTGYRVDVSDSSCVEEIYRKTIDECGPVDIIIQCAGVVTSNKTFDKLTLQDIDRTMKINSLAPMYIARLALPDMLERGKGHICNIASQAGMISNPNMSVYAASKWSVIGWSDSVRVELGLSKSPVRFTTIAPYYINTGMFDGVTSRIFPILDPVKTAAKIIKAIEKNKDFKGLPWSFHFVRLMQGLLPTCMFDYIFGQIFGIYHTMDHFTGRRN